MIVGGESNDIEEFKEGDRVVLNHLLEGTVEYISKIGFAEVFFKTDCGCGRLPVSLKELEKMTMAKMYIKLWDSYESYFEPLSDAEVGRLVRAMMKYKSLRVEPEFNGNERFTWPAIKRELDEDAAYTKKKSDIGKLGGAPLENNNAEKKTSKNNQKQAGHRTKDKGLRKRSSSSSDETTTNPIVDEFEKSIGKLSEKQANELMSYIRLMGDELVLTIIAKCSDLGGHTWAYVRKALEEAKRLECKTADEYNKIAPIGGGRAKRVDREMSSGNDFLSGTNFEHNLERMRKQKVQVM